MSDLSQDGVSASFVEQVFETMTRADRHTFQLLTQWARRMRVLVRALPDHLVGHPHVWLGVSVEDRSCGVPRIDLLRQGPRPSASSSRSSPCSKTSASST